jgi:acetyltransferase
VRDLTSTALERTYRTSAVIRLRDIRSDDKAALVRFHRRLSAESRYRRYHAAKGDLTTSDLRYLTEVDGHHHVALVAELPPPELEGVAGPVADFVGIPEVPRLEGVARIVGDPAAPGEAEVAIVVADDAHGSGLGADLIEGVLERGRQEGVRTAVAQVQADNHRALRLFQGMGFRQRGSSGAVIELVHDLDDEPIA